MLVFYCNPNPAIGCFSFRTSELYDPRLDLDVQGSIDPFGTFLGFYQRIIYQLAQVMSKVFLVVVRSGNLPNICKL